MIMLGFPSTTFKLLGFWKIPETTWRVFIATKRCMLVLWFSRFL